MDLDAMRGTSDQILNCEIKDETGLNDFQKLPDESAIAIHKVGIERFRIPLKFKHADGELLSHDTEASMFVSLKEGKTGVNMSRFCQILQKHADQKGIDAGFFKDTIGAFRTELRDYDTEDPIESAFLKLSFSYPLKQASLKSDNWGWQYYDCDLAGENQKDGTVQMSLTVRYEYSSTCPCSLSMSKQYEKEYSEGKTQEGRGIAAAHGQRSIATCELKFNDSLPLSIEEAVSLIRTALPTETQSLVKRVDEQAFAILNGENPMFVEHASRRLAHVFDQVEKILDWNVKVEHLESLHSHNAVAYIKKSFNQPLQ